MSQQVESQAVDEARRQIQDLVRQIRELSEGDLEPRQYFAEFLTALVRGLGGMGGAVWAVGQGGKPAPLFQMNVSKSLLDNESEDGESHFRLIDHVFTGQEPQLAQPHSTSGEEGKAGNPTDFLLVLAPIIVKTQTSAVIEVFQRPGADGNTQRGYLRFLVQMCGLAADWTKSRQLRQLNSQVSLLSRYDQFIKNVYAGLSSKQTAYSIANETRGLVECDRASVAIQHGRKSKIEAVSGQDTLDKRSNVVHLLGKLASKVVATAEPLWYTGSMDDLPPQIEEALKLYVEESHAKSVVVIPIFEPESKKKTDDQSDQVESDDANSQSRQASEVIGALIVEKIEDVLPRDEITSQLEMIQDHAGRALGNALEHTNLPLMPVMRAAGVVTGLFRGRTRRKTLAVLAVIVALLLCISFVPIDFEMEGRATLQPVERHDLFAAVEGKVVDLKVTSGDVVTKDQVLLVLENPTLEMEVEKNRGDLEATEKEIESLNYVALESKEMTKDERLNLFVKLDTLETNRRNLGIQQEILDRKKRGLTIKSPINGRVATWDVEELLRDRPVSPHQVLLTVYDPGGEWELDVNMPEKRVGHINDARQKLKGDEKLVVEYVLVSEPDVTRYGALEEMQPQTKLHEEEGHSVLFRVSIDVDNPDVPIEDPRLGLMAKAQVKCGQRPIGYVYLHEAWEWAQVNIFFKLF
jgi:hypothetical protein